MRRRDFSCLFDNESFLGYNRDVINEKTGEQSPFSLFLANVRRDPYENT